jgi:hypothetical protein
LKEIFSEKRGMTEITADEMLGVEEKDSSVQHTLMITLMMTLLVGTDEALNLLMGLGVKINQHLSSTGRMKDRMPKGLEDRVVVDTGVEKDRKGVEY